jgi:hypothetical protein
MTLLKQLVPWINIITLFWIFDCMLLYTKRSIPPLAKKYLSGESLESFIKRRILTQLVFAAGFYGTTLSKNLLIPDFYKFIISLTGLALLFIALFLNIQNNRRYLNRWTASF